MNVLRKKICILLAAAVTLSFSSIVSADDISENTDTPELLETAQNNVFSVRIPYDVSFSIILLSGTDNGWVSSDDFEVVNNGENDVIVKFSSVYYTFSEKEDFISVDSEEDVKNITDKKAFFMKMVCDGNVNKEEYVIKDLENTDEDAVEFLLKGYNSGSSENKGTFNFSGAANPLSEIPWKSKDVTVHIKFSIYNADTEEFLGENEILSVFDNMTEEISTEEESTEEESSEEIFETIVTDIENDMEEDKGIDEENAISGDENIIEDEQVNSDRNDNAGTDVLESSESGAETKNLNTGSSGGGVSSGITSSAAVVVTTEETTEQTTESNSGISSGGAVSSDVTSSAAIDVTTEITTEQTTEGNSANSGTNSEGSSSDIVSSAAINVTTEETTEQTTGKDEIIEGNEYDGNDNCEEADDVISNSAVKNEFLNEISKNDDLTSNSAVEADVFENSSNSDINSSVVINANEDVIVDSEEKLLLKN